MSSPETELVLVLDRYVARFNSDSIDEPLKKTVAEVASRTRDGNAFRVVADRMWTEYSCVDVLIMAKVLRAWLEVEPGSKAAKRALATYLLAHGPDWDNEAQELLRQCEAG